MKAEFSPFPFSSRAEHRRSETYKERTPHMQGWLVISVYLSSLPFAYLSDATRRRYGESARMQYETTENSAWFSINLGGKARSNRTSHRSRPKDYY